MPATRDDLLAVERLVGALSPEQFKALIEQPAVAAELNKPWRANPGPQTKAKNSRADELLYGGQGGGGKTELLLGLALTEHRRSLLMRRQYTDGRAMVERALAIHGSRDGFNGSPPPSLKTKDGRHIEFGAAAHAGDEQSWQGQPHDLLGIDEAAQFLGSQVRFLMGWVRTTIKGQRCRVVLATNPPLSDEGNYLVEMFAPWLDPVFPNPAKPGELRHYIYDPVDRRDRWVEGPGEFQNDAGEMVETKSRTFIPASVDDNPDLVDTGYPRTLDALPEPLRSAVRDGNFMAARQDHEFQVIPTAWIDAAQARWKPDGWKGLSMTAMGLDPAGGGRDSAELAPRYGGWYGLLVSAKGEVTADGSATAGLVVRHRKDACPIVVDVGGGYAGAVIERFKDNQIDFRRFDGAAASHARAKGTGLGFVNKRAETWWRFREELDPDQEGGSAIALPPDPELKADLAAPRWTLKARGIQLESKEDIRDRIGRSPGKGDAVVMALSEGNKAAMKRMGRGGQLPKVALGYQHAKRR